MGADVAAVRRAVEEVPDPELPPVTIGMLGMVHDVRVADGDRAEVELLPTFSGCPATEMIEQDVVTAVGEVAGVHDVRVRFRFDPPWTPQRISPEGRERLREFGIAPPGHPTGQALAADGRHSLPVIAAPSGHTHPADPRPCPYCGATDTVRESAFGPTPCRDLRFCDTCQQPFEAFKA